jgi:Flp pilus assembly protein CpaB
MKNRGGRFLLILGAGLAILAFAVVYLLTSKSPIGKASDQPVQPTPPPMVDVVVVNQNVPAYTVLDATNVGTLQVDASTAVSGTTNTPGLVYGKMTTSPMTKGQAILTNQLTTAGFSNVLDKGHRAFTLPVPERNNFGGMITENDLVDILWTHEYEVSQFVAGPDGKPQEKVMKLPTTKTLLQNVRVMRVISLRAATAPVQGQQTDPNSDAQSSAAAARKPAAATAANYAPDAGVSTVLILDVTDQQAEVMKFANEQGTIDLSLRSSKTFKGADGKEVQGDKDPEHTTGITDKVLVEQYGLLLPEILVK